MRERNGFNQRDTRVPRRNILAALLVGCLNSVSKRIAFTVVMVFLALALVTPLAFAVEGYDGRDRGSDTEIPKELKDVGIEEHLGETVDLSLEFKNESGETVSLGGLLKSRKPILLSLAYYSCPGLCNFHLNGMNDAFRQMKKPLGTEFDHVVVSIDPSEKPSLAAEKKASYVKAYGRVEGAKGWHFLTGDEASIKKLAAQVGFKYRWDEKEKQWAHAAAAMVITPEGRISRYLYGIIFDPQVMRLSAIEASNGAIGSLVDKLTLFCFHFDPRSSKYTLYAFNVMRAGGGLMVMLMAAFLVPFWIRSRKELQGEA